MNWKDFLREFWTEFSAHVEETKDLRVTEVLDRLNEIMGPHVFPDPGDGSDPRKCPSCEDGRVSLKVGKFGAFIGCSNYPDCRFTRQLTKSDGDDQASDAGPKLLGQDENGVDITLRSGRFGAYVQRGEPEGKEKPPRASIPKLIALEDIDLEIALRYLSLPREVGLHPESGKPILAAIGRYGPYVQHERTYANLPSPEDVFTIGLNHAVTLIAEKVAKGGGRSAAKALKELGEHPTDGGPVSVMDGRYGPYVKHGKINATLPKDTDPLAVTMDQAVELIAARAAKGGTKRKIKPKAKPKAKAKTKPKSKAAE